MGDDTYIEVPIKWLERLSEYSKKANKEFEEEDIIFQVGVVQLIGYSSSVDSIIKYEKHITK